MCGDLREDSVRIATSAVNVLMVATTIAAAGAIAFRAREVARNASPSQLSAYKRWKDVSAVGASVGPTHARVTIVVFSDFQCPYCKRFADSSRAVLSRYPDGVRMVFRHRPIEQLHPHAEGAARAAICADRVNRFAAMHDLLFDHQDSIGVKTWASFALDAGLADTNTFNMCLQSSQTTLALATDRSAADRVGVSGTPLVLVNGVMIRGMPQRSVLDSLVRQVLGR